jgi:hypothetical protein
MESSPVISINGESVWIKCERPKLTLSKDVSMSGGVSGERQRRLMKGERKRGNLVGWQCHERERGWVGRGNGRWQVTGGGGTRWWKRNYFTHNTFSFKSCRAPLTLSNAIDGRWCIWGKWCRMRERGGTSKTAAPWGINRLSRQREWMWWQEVLSHDRGSRGGKMGRRFHLKWLVIH